MKRIFCLSKDLIFENIPDVEITMIYTTIIDTIENIYKYNNSVYGILDNITNDYENLNFDINSLWNKLSEKDVEESTTIVSQIGVAPIIEMLKQKASNR